MTFATTNIEFWTTAADRDAMGQADGSFGSGEQTRTIAEDNVIQGSVSRYDLAI